ncbi:MAG TPA: LapA family protein [Acidimicrobiia bacterium]|nr:LapA family protein [Acidimicrobiia bacterium]
MTDDQPRNVRDSNDRIGIGLIVTVIVVVIVGIFVMQNRHPVQIEFLFLNVSRPVWLVAVIFLVLGAALGWAWRWVRGRRSRR